MNFFTPELLRDLPDQRELLDRPRQAIVPNSEILGGVFTSRVGIVVDTEENPEPYNIVIGKVKDEIDLHLTHYTEELTLLHILNYIKNTVAKTALYHPSQYHSLVEERYGVSQGEASPGEPRVLVGLSDFLAEGANNCQHYGLLAGATIRLLQEDVEYPHRIDPSFAVSIENGKPWTEHTDRHVYTVLNNGDSEFMIEPTSPFVHETLLIS